MSILTEYNEEQVLRNRFKEGREVGIAEGKEIGIIEGRTQNLLSQICRKLKKGKTYYVKVRAYKTVGGTKLYGSFSSVKNAKIK